MSPLATLPVIHPVHPKQYQQFTTEELRTHFLVNNLTKAHGFNLFYTHYDRIIVGLVSPKSEQHILPNYHNLRSDYFLERREIGIINIGGAGTINADGQIYTLEKLDCLYLGKGSGEVIFTSNDAAIPAVFYLLSSTAHKSYPTRLMKSGEALPVSVGSADTSNARTIYKYIHLQGIESCQLVMGLTILNKGSVWNTMPAHLHDRRSEVYFYFDMAEDERVMHFMGEPDHTRNIVVGNYEAVLSPSWSIHSGCGTTSYSFIWGMAGENQDYTDMDVYPAKALL